MKRSLSCLLTAMLVISCGGGNDGAGPGDGGGNNNPLPQPMPTASGTPNGPATTQSIGTAGGTLTSSDGLFSITIPAGALPVVASSSALETEITIQPITNTAWGGTGDAYRLLPDGLAFAVPVELHFALEDSLLWGSDTLFVDVARQDDDGVWGILKHRTIDWESRTLTCTTSHFSDYSMIEGLQIRPAAASIGTMGTVNLTVKYCQQETIPGGGQDDLVALVYGCSDDEDLAPLGTFSNWSVNGLGGGNSTVGTVVKTVASSANARYTAPATVPQANPVAVSVQARGRRGSTLLVSNITIGGVWWGTVTIRQGAQSLVADVTWTQVGTYQGLETFRPSGTVVYTPETDYGPLCWFVSMEPRSTPIEPDRGVMFIDWNNSPARAYGSGAIDATTTTCFTCDGWTQPDCQTGPFPGWFAADSLAVSPSGDAIFFEHTDNGSSPPVYTRIDFKKGLPPITSVVRQ